MLHNTPDEIGAIVLLRSDSLLYTMCKSGATYVEGLQKIANEGLRDFYPSTFRKEALEGISHTFRYHELDDKKEEAYRLDFLENLYEKFYEPHTEGERLACKPEKLENYSAVINKIHPYCIIGYKLAKWLGSEHISYANIERFADYITPLALPLPENKKIYADLHLHLGGANENIMNITELLFSSTQKKWYTPDILKELPRLTEFSKINSGELSLGQVIDVAKIALYLIRQYLFQDKRSLADICSLWSNVIHFGHVANTRMYEVKAFCNAFGKYSYIKGDEQNIAIRLWNGAVKRYNANDYKGFWFILHILLHYLYLNCQNRYVRKSILVFFHAVHIVRSYQIMSQNTGLAYFSEFFGSSIRQVTYNRQKNIAENIFLTGTTYAELKLSPSDAYKEEKISKYCQAIDTLKRSRKRIKYQFSVHFIKEKDKNTQVGESLLKPIRHKKLRKKLKKEAKELHRFLYDDYDTFTLQTIKGKITIDPAQKIATIDAAGVESLTPPEVFAPAFNYLRAFPKKLDWRYDFVRIARRRELPYRKLRLSVHAGEDFDHIATGMRRIDEAIEYFDMGEADRLGHALAVGLQPKRWLQRNGPVYTTKEILLDNLVWLADWAYRLSGSLNFSVVLAKRYEKQAKKLYEELYFDIKKVVPFDLHTMMEAWRLRRNCPDLYFMETDLKESDFYRRAVLKDERDPESHAYALFYYYHRKREPDVWESVIRIDYVPNSSGIEGGSNYKKIDDYDLQFYEAVQDALLQKIADKRITIEANPSSNVYIAFLNGYEEHPIFRWDPVREFNEEEMRRYNRFGIRKGQVNVCINTDDPAIFPTSLYSEFLHLKNAAERLKYHNSDIDRWLEKLRKRGEEIFMESYRS
jgi:adenosine deaminase